MDYRIRQAKEVDLPSISRIEAASHPRPWTRDDFKWELENACGRFHFWVAAESCTERPVAYICFHFVIDEIYIRNLTVEPAERRMGIGRRLLELSCQWGKRKGAKRVVLDVRIGNSEALKFYRNCGFDLIKGYINRSSRLMEKILL